MTIIINWKHGASLNRPASCTKGFRFWYSASMLSFCMTVCRLQTAQTDDRTQFCIYFSMFYLPRDYMYRGLKKIINSLLYHKNNNSRGLITSSSLSLLNLSRHKEHCGILVLAERGRKISEVSGDDRGDSYLLQPLSVLIQRYNLQVQHYVAARELHWEPPGSEARRVLNIFFNH